MTPGGADPEDVDLDTRLDDAVLDDEQELAEAVDTFINANPIAREQAMEIVAHQDHLRRLLDPDGWVYVLRLEELTTARWADLAVEIARWAYAEGRRNGSASPRQ